jgi:D-threo-aldose 1-dehydrogenase
VDALELPSLGFGGAPIGNLFQATSDEDAARTIEAAWDSGIRYFDTAPHYGLGLSERRLGEALRAHPRAEYIVSTKVGRLLVPATTVPGRDDDMFDVAATHHRVRDYSADGVRRSLDASLERLGLDRIDIVLIHDPDDHADEAIEQAAPALSALRAEGTIRAYGAGMIHSAPLTRFVRETDVDVVMVAGRYNLLDQTAARDLLPEALRRGVKVINAGVFGSGLLALPWPRPDATYDYRPASTALVERARHLARICNHFGVDLPTVALAFAANHPAVASVVVGLRSPEEVADVVRRGAQPVPEGIWAWTCTRPTAASEESRIPFDES